MHRFVRQRSRVLRGGAAAFGLAALVASLAIITHPVGSASATISSGPSVQIVHGCANDTSDGDFVVATVHSGNGPIDPSNPEIIQLGLAVSRNNEDAYGDGAGPVLINFTGVSQVVRLTGPIKGAHVFVQRYGSDSPYQTIPVPALCSHIPTPVFEQHAPQVTRSGIAANCVHQDATLPVTVWNDGPVDADYTLLLVDANGRIVGSDPQGVPLTVPANSQRTITVAQPYVSLTKVYQFTVRALGITGEYPQTTGVRGVQCDSNGHHGPQPTQTPTLPHQSPTPPAGNPSSSTGHSAHPSSGSSHSQPAHSAPASSHSAPVASASNSSAPNAGGNGSSSGTNNGSSGGAVTVSSDNGGPVLGDADSTRQPAKPSSTAPIPVTKKILSEAALSYGVSPSFAIGGALILLAFGAAIAGMVLANRASARRR